MGIMVEGGANKAGNHGQGGFDHIKVLVRIRPAQAAHGDRALAPSLAYGLGNSRQPQDAGETEPVVRVTKGQTCFEGEFDGVLPPGATQSRVFDEVRECITHVVAGKNASIFAYGQTNSGKTYTMLGPPAAVTVSLDECTGGALKHAELGIVPRALAQLLAAKQEATESGEAMSIECCYLQVYNERVLDLLANPDAVSLSTTCTGGAGAADTQRRRGTGVRERVERSDADLKIRAGALGVEVVGAVKRRIETMAHVSALLKEGSHYRKVRETKYNEASSRSHLILQVFLTRRTPQPAAEDTSGAPATDGSAQMLFLSSTLSLVDLAGSERWDPQSFEGVLGKARTKEELRQLRASEGEKLVHRDEMAKINRSLTTLGRLVSMLSKGQDKGLPYRESKLTRLLQHSLGANSVTMMIATLSPEHEAADENICTLTFALSARQVKVHAHVNSIVEGQTELALRAYKLLIEQLKRQLKEASASSSQASVLSDEMSVMQRKAQEQNLEIARLKGLLKASGPKKKGEGGHQGGVDQEHVKHLRGIKSKQSHL